MASAVISWTKRSRYQLLSLCLSVFRLLSLSTRLFQSGSLSVAIFTVASVSIAFTFHKSTSAMTHVNYKEYLGLMAPTTGPGLLDCECHMLNEFIRGSCF